MRTKPSVFVPLLVSLSISTVHASPVGRWSLNEGGGTTAGDASGQGNHGFFVDSPAWIPGVRGTGLAFSGSARVLVQDSPSLNPVGAFTLAAWIRPNARATQYVVKKARYDANDGVELSLSKTSRKAFVRINQASGGNRYRVSSTSLYPTDGATWMHLAATFDGAEIKLYVNGVLENSLSAPGLTMGTNTLPLSFGAQDDGTGQFNGALDEIFLFSNALTGSEVRDLMAGTYFQDTDGDGVLDANDAFPLDPTEWADSDGDGIGDNADPDDDNDGMDDGWESFFGLDPHDPTDASVDGDGDGQSNLAEFRQGTHPRRTRVSPNAETVPVESSGDAADDPAIWIHPSDRALSRVIGTDKELGLAVYNLAGNQVQFLPEGRINSVDIRYDFPLGAERVDIVAGSNRTDDTITIHKVNTETGFLADIAAGGGIPSGITVYGLCMYVSPITGKYYAFVNSKTGMVEQWELFHSAGRVGGILVRSFDVGTQPEGCVADDEHGYFYIGEEAVGIWRYGAEPDAGATRVQIDSTGSGGHLTADVEGLAIYYGSNGDGYLIASSQGSNDFVIYRRGMDNPYLGTFRIVDGNGFRGAVATDGIEVISAGLGPAFPEGLFIAHHDSTFDPSGNSNFKMVSWGAIARSFNPPLTVDTGWNPRSASTSGPVGNWPLDEGSGTSALDASGTGNNAQLNGSPQWITGRKGKALAFGFGARALVADSASLDLTDAITIAAWIRPNARGTQDVIKKGRYDSVNGFEISLSSTENKPFIRFNERSSGNKYRLFTTTPYPTDGITWMHLAASFDGTEIKIYVNGTQEGSLPASGLVIAANDLPLSIGAQDDGKRPFNGAIDEVRIYPRALSAFEVMNLTALGSSVDSDGDGVADSLDAFPFDPTEWADTDLDGIGDNADTDDDNDGMPDSWENIHNFNPLDPTDAAQDADGDGVTNLDEYLQGTNPRDGLGSVEVGNWAFDEGGGSTAGDSSGLGNHGAFAGAPSWVAGVRGTALRVSGTGDRVLIPDAPSLDMTGAITIAAWLRPEALATQYVIKKARYGLADGFEIGLSLSTGQIYVRFNQQSQGNTYRLNSTSIYPTDGATWVHVAATFDGEAIKLYINGLLEGFRLASGLIIGSNDYPLSIGAQDDGFEPFKGSIDNVHLYNYGLSEAEIQNLIASDLPADTDGDGVVDAQDLFPNDPTEWADADLDGIGDNADPDDDNDGMTDIFEIYYRLDPFDPSDAAGDADGDGITNIQEHNQGSDPRGNVAGGYSYGEVGHWSFDEGAGASALDRSAFGNHGALAGPAAWVAGVSGNALSFGGGARVLVPDSLPLDRSRGITVAAWIRTGSVAEQTVIKKARLGVINGYELGLSAAGRIYARFNQASAGDAWRVSSASLYPTDGTWIHAAATFDGQMIRLYVDGALEASLAASGLVIGTNSIDLSIGAQDDGSLPLSGAVDQVHLHDLALSEDDIRFIIGSEALPGLALWQSQTLASRATTMTTGEKPQSKVWQFQDRWWAIFPDGTGTWIWRLDDASWTKVLRLSTRQDTQADYALDGDPGLLHILLFSGSATQLASAEYVTGTPGTYRLWTARPGLVNVPVSSSAETATIAIDSTRRLWVASDTTTRVEVCNSAAAGNFTSWNTPLTLVSGIAADDIAAIVAFDGKVGVLWSNQNTERFGFRFHVDGAPLSEWSDNEAPGAASALNVGQGLSDDHLNIAVASDGTLYAVVKTNYGTGTHTRIGLLVRRPSTGWDFNLYHIDTQGTRGIVALNEAVGEILAIYTEDELGGDIFYRVSDAASIAFGTRRTLITGSNLNDASCPKQPFLFDLVVLSSTGGANREVRGVLFRP